MSSPDRTAAFARLQGALDVRARHRPRGEGTVDLLLTGLAGIDEVCGGLPRGAITELVCGAPSCGSQLLWAQLLEVTRAAQQRVVLIDGNDAFDPPSHREDSCRHLVWVRCRGSAEALAAADIMARDANFGLAVVDLKQADERELRRTPSAAWYRLQRAVENSALVLLVKTPRPTVPSAQLRLELQPRYSLRSLADERSALLGRLVPQVRRQRLRLLEAAVAG